MVFEFLAGQSDLGILALRLLLGGLMMLHGYPKLTLQRRQTIQWLRSMGIPGAAGPVAGLQEFLGGLFWVIGFLTPIVGVLFVIEMISTTIFSKTKLGKKLLLGYELDLLYLAGALALIFLGGGAYSVDRVLRL